MQSTAWFLRSTPQTGVKREDAKLPSYAHQLPGLADTECYKDNVKLPDM